MRITTACILLCFAVFSCKPPQQDKTSILTVTIEPQKYFLNTITGGRFNIDCIVPPGSNPESADFAPSQMMSLNKSTAYFKIGYMGIENMLAGKVLQGNPGLVFVDCSAGIEIIGGAHGHDHCHAGGDPHIWSSVKPASIIAGNMYKAMLELDKENEADYTRNYNKLQAEFNRTDSIIRSYLEKAPCKSFIIYHPALSYFADEYKLTQYTIEHEGKNPSPSQLKELIDKARAERIKVVFIQQEFDTKNAKTVAEAIGAKIVPVNLFSYNWSREMIRIAKALSQEDI
jgi:zinc transport system substrate-binding protein